jgi:hypothetical protein
MMKKFIGRNFVIIILALAALGTALPAPIDTFPGNRYVGRICLIFCFMITAAGLDEGGVYHLIHSRMRGRLSPAAAYFIILTVCYFSGAIITPYGAVITAAPLLLKLFDGKTLLFAFPAVSAAATLGGFLSPVSSFYNAFFTFSGGVSPDVLVLELLPFSLAGFALVFAASLPVGKAYSQYDGIREVHPEPVYISVFLILLIITVLAVGGLFDGIAAFISVCLVIVILEPKLMRKPDYPMLVMLFLLSVTAWNITRTDLLPLPENPFFAAVMLTNVISAENAAAFLSESGITSEILTAGINIGAAGFIFATPAALAAYSYTVSSDNSKPVAALGVFAAQGIILTAALSAMYFVIN